MQRIILDDTIAAIATAKGEGGIGIVRISGPNALKIADKAFLSKDRKKPSEFKSYTVHYGWIADETTNIIDEVLLTVMRSPKSYTKEDVVEINCHGGIVALRAILEFVLANGCRLAGPGEFTRRAFLNGRIDLAQAEAVLDIIRSKTDSALKVGLEQLKGGLSQQLRTIRQQLINMLSAIEAGIDFPGEEIDGAGLTKIARGILKIKGSLEGLLKDSKRGRVLREGVHAVICGRPNVGKSSLLNALLKKERSIVTPVAGTTRDTVEEIIDIKGIPVRIVDTAGILEPRDLIEKKAVSRSREQMESADLAILLFDAGKQLNKDDHSLIARLRKKTTIAVINKIDLKQKVDRDKIKRNFTHVIEICAKRLKNIDLLEDLIADLVYRGQVNAAEPSMVSNLRHIEKIAEAKDFIAQAADSVDNKLSPEFIADDLKGALSSVDAILGKSFSEDLLDRIFSEFCIGK